MSVESLAVKRSLGDWCEMAASVEVVSCREAVKIELEALKMKNFH
jgi:hypothetical protein